MDYAAGVAESRHGFAVSTEQPEVRAPKIPGVSRAETATGQLGSGQCDCARIGAGIESASGPAAATFRAASQLGKVADQCPSAANCASRGKARTNAEAAGSRRQSPPEAVKPEVVQVPTTPATVKVAIDNAPPQQTITRHHRQTHFLPGPLPTEPVVASPPADRHKRRRRRRRRSAAFFRELIR